MRLSFAFALILTSGGCAAPAVPANWSKSNTHWVDMAASTDHAKALACIRSGQIPPNIADEDGNTPLMMASREGDLPAAQELVARGADINAHTNYHYDPLRCAIAGRNADIVALLLAHGANANDDFVDGVMPLQEASALGSLSMVNSLIDRGAKISAQAKDGQDALGNAAARDNTEVIATLIDHGADPNQFANNHMTPLMLAALSGHAASVKILLKRGAKIDLQSDDYLATALQLASSRTASPNSDPRSVVKILLAAGANATLPDKNGRTALMDAASAQDAEMIRVLVAARGIDLKSSTGEGVRAMREVMEQKSYLSLCALLDGGVNPNARYENDRTPLFDAIGQQDLKVVQLLIADKAFVNVTRSQGFSGTYFGDKPPGPYVYSPLVAASDLESSAIVKALLQAGANPTLRTATAGLR